MNQFKRMAYPYVAWIAVMILAPMLMIVMYAFIEKGNDVTTFRFTISNFTKFFSDKVYIDVLYRSLYVAIVHNNNLFANRLPYGIYNIESKAKAQNMACAYDNISYMDKYACAYLCVAWNTPGQRHSKHNTRFVWNRYGKNNIY